jgi:ribokinase
MASELALGRLAAASACAGLQKRFVGTMDDDAAEPAGTAEQPENGAQMRAVDDHERRASARRADDRVGDVICAHRLFVAHAAGLAPRDFAAELLGLHVSGADHAGTDATSGKLVLQHLSEADETPFAGAVGGVRRPSDQTQLGRDEHDPPIAACPHARQHGLCEPERAADVNAPALFEVLGLDILDEVAVQDTGAAHQHVDCTERRDHLIDRARTLRPIGDIRHNRVGPLPQLARELVEPATIASNEADLRSERSELARARLPDTPRGTSDQHCFPGKLRHPASLRRKLALQSDRTCTLALSRVDRRPVNHLAGALGRAASRAELPCATTIRRVRVAVVGHVEWVEFLPVDHVPLAGEIVHVEGSWAEPAGGGAGTAVQLARLAGGSSFFTAVGEDALGERSLGRLAELGVAVHAARRDAPTRRAFTFLDRNAERTITTLGDRLEPHGADHLPWAALAETDAVYFSAGDADAARYARAARVLVGTPRGAKALFDVPLDALVYSAKDADERAAAEAMAPRPSLLVATEGAAGGSWRSSRGVSGRWKPASPPGPVVDQYGAGDCFAAGLTFGLGSGLGTADAIELAARCGAWCTSGRGPYEGQLRTP